MHTQHPPSGRTARSLAFVPHRLADRAHHTSAAMQATDKARRCPRRILASRHGPPSSSTPTTSAFPSAVATTSTASTRSKASATRALRCTMSRATKIRNPRSCLMKTIRPTSVPTRLQRTKATNQSSRTEMSQTLESRQTTTTRRMMTTHRGRRTGGVVDHNQHELLRPRMLRRRSSNALGTPGAHLHLSRGQQ